MNNVKRIICNEVIGGQREDDEDKLDDVSEAIFNALSQGKILRIIAEELKRVK